MCNLVELIKARFEIYKYLSISKGQVGQGTSATMNIKITIRHNTNL